MTKLNEINDDLNKEVDDLELNHSLDELFLNIL